MLKLSDESFGFWRPEGEQIAECHVECILCIPSKKLFDESWIETIKASGYRRVRGEDVSRSRDGKRDLERLSGFFHEISGALQRSEGCVSFIQVTDFWLDAQGA